MLAKTKKIIKRVAIFGGADAKKTDQSYIDAYNTAKILAENGYIVVNGGGAGIMLAATLGAKAGGGKVETVVIDPKKKIKNFEGYNQENHDATDKIYKTKNYSDRLNKLIEVGDAFVIFNGGVGTLSEVGLTWQMAKFEYGDREHEPLIFFGDGLANLINQLVNNQKYEELEKKLYEIVYTPEEVLTTIKNRRGSHKNEKIGWIEKLMGFFS
jgi:uncharacterized protein (TIGR00725 family)